MPTEYGGLKFWKLGWLLNLTYLSDVYRNRSSDIQHNSYSDSHWAHKEVYSLTFRHRAFSI